MEELAQVYARSLFEVAKEDGKLDLVREQLGAIADVLAVDRDLQVFFFSPYFSTQEKKGGLRRAIVDADETILNFLELLIENHRMPVLLRVRRNFDQRWEEENRRLNVEVTSAVPLDEATLDQIRTRVGEQTHREIEMRSAIDPSILGGIVVRVGNSILDASIRNRLEQLRKEVAKAT